MKIMSPRGYQARRSRVWLALKNVGAVLGATVLIAVSVSAHAPHQVRPGETLGSIAAEHLGSSARWREIAALNKQVPPNRMAPGTWLKMPGYTPERRVMDISGQVEYRDSGSVAWNPVAPGSRVPESTEIRTGPGSHVSIRTENEGTVYVREQSEVSLPSLKSSDRRILLRSGSLSAEVVNGTRAREFIIETPTSVAGVRGTRFLVDHEAGAGRTAVSVWEGGVAHSAADVTVTVPQGHGSSARAGEPPTPPSPLPKSPALIAPAANRFIEESAITFTWDAVANVSDYLLEISRDARFEKLESAQIVPAPSAGSRVSATVSRLPAADLFWRVSSRTADHLEGSPSPARRLKIAPPRDVLRRLYSARRFQEVIRYVDGMASPAKEHRILKASALYRLSLIKEAEREYLQIKTGAPDDYEVMLGLAWCAYRLEKDEDAERQFGVLLRLNPNDAEALSGMGFLRYRAERWDEAVDYFKRSLAVNPGNTEVEEYLNDARQKRH